MVFHLGVASALVDRSECVRMCMYVRVYTYIHTYIHISFCKLLLTDKIISLCRLGHDGVDLIHFCGASCGSLISAALVSHVNMKAFRAFVFDMLEVALTRFMGPVGCMTTFVEEVCA